MFRSIKVFLQEARQELKKVNWPSRNETMRLTTVVIIISLLFAFFLGVFDYIFIYLLNLLVNSKF